MEITPASPHEEGTHDALVRAPSVRASDVPSSKKRPGSRESTPAAREEEEDTIGSEINGGVTRTLKGKRRKSASSSSPMTAARTLPLLICSVGNPGSTYANTLHSAGHTVVNRLAAHLGYTQPRKERELGNGLVARPAITGGTGDWTLWQSTSYMNESGKGVRAANAAWSRGIPIGEEGRLVVIYDELEKPLGVVTVRTAQGASAKGHNGLKSIMSVMNSTLFARIGVGIGRPISRDSGEVARYVLRKMTPVEKEKIEGCVEDVVKKLKQLERG
ncbi:hypothetical protein LTR08_004374 [Meristemomyces frigidus]|nr:hypothetical protein LTR08_004374 [Meristemomyces frigidus]